MSGESLEPITREEMFIAKAAGMDVDTPEPITRREMFLSMIQPGGGVAIKNQDKTITENGTYKADSGYTGLGTVSVNVPSSGIVPSGTIDITENGSYDVTNFATALVEIAASGGGGKIATGTFVLGESANSIEIEHNLGEVPKIAAYMYEPQNEQIRKEAVTPGTAAFGFSIDQTYCAVVYTFSGDITSALSVSTMATTNTRAWHTNSSMHGTQAVCYKATETTCTFMPMTSNANVRFNGATKYRWIVIGEGI